MKIIKSEINEFNEVINLEKICFFDKGLVTLGGKQAETIDFYFSTMVGDKVRWLYRNDSDRDKEFNRILDLCESLK